MASGDRATQSALRAPLRWIGYSWEPERRVRFTAADGQRFEVSLGVAVEEGLFECETTTPHRRDALRTWATVGGRLPPAPAGDDV